jgi:hypothetical protein
MEVIGTLIAIVAALLVVAYVAQPFFAPNLRRDEGLKGREIAGLQDRSTLLEERNRLYRAIKELDADRQTGKVNEEDYADQRYQLMAQSVEIVQQIDAMGQALPPEEDPIERAIRAARTGEPTVIEAAEPAAPAVARFCPQCGTPSTAGDQFCGNCGASLA